MIGYEPYGPDLDAHITGNCGQDALKPLGEHDDDCDCFECAATREGDAIDHAYDEWADREGME